MNAAAARAGQRRAARLGGALIAALIAALLAPRLVTPGEYVDGLLYATIARNLSVGVGTAWHPRYTPTVHADFHEHPPLGLVIESWSFRALGDHFWTEKVHALLLALVSAALVAWLWRAFTGRSGRGLGWLPFALWATMPLAAWMVVNAMLEDGICVTALAAVAALVAAERARSAPARLAWGAGAAAVLAAGAWIKGPMALFPLAWPALAALCAPRPSLGSVARGVGASAALTLAVVALFAATLAHHDAAESMRRYWQQQLGASLSGARAGHAGSRLRLLDGLKDQAQIGAGLVVLLLIVPATRRRMLSGLRDPRARACVALALCGTLPIMATSRFATHYLGPALPFLALGVALACRRPLRALVAAAARAPQGLARAAPAIAAATIAILVVALAARRDSIMRDADQNRAVAALRGAGPGFGDVVGGDPGYAQDWRRHAYYARFLGIGLDCEPSGASRAWWLGPADRDPPAGFTPVAAPLPDGARLSARR